jgi:superfamily II DNA/RNA helicase
MTFSDLNLNASLLKALEQLGYTNPTPIQLKAIPPVLDKQDVIASAQTGTGKTAAFLLPALENIINNPVKHAKPRVLVLSPTRELAQQIEKAARDYSRHIKMSCVSLVGGMPYPPQIRALSRPLDIVIATPGRLMDHLERSRIDLSAVTMLVLDEADRMLDMGFYEDVEYIASLCGKKNAEGVTKRQTVLFSATIDSKMEKLASKLLNNPVRIKIETERTNAKQIEQSVYLADGMQHKTAILSRILQQEPIFKGIIFTATKVAADDLAKNLADQGHKAAAMHGDMRQAKRIKTLDQLRNGRLQLIVATDVAARGIDVNDITHVINFDMPKFAEDYVHRVGRTGRAGKSGKAITFTTLQERKHLQGIEKYLGKAITLSVIEGLEPKAKLSSEPAKPKRRFGRNENTPSRFSANKPKSSRFAAKPEQAGEKKRPYFGKSQAAAKPKGPAGSRPKKVVNY